MCKHYILYVPGLGDRYDPMRRFLLAGWRMYGVRTKLVSMNWLNSESYESKLERLGKIIDEKHKNGYKVTLIGESAGGSMVLNAYPLYSDKLFRVMTICGKNTRPHKVSPRLYEKNKAFKVSMYDSVDAISQLSLAQRQAFVSVHPIFDETVPVKETLIPDCQSVRLWSMGHFTSIIFALTAASWLMVRIATRK